MDLKLKTLVDKGSFDFKGDIVKVYTHPTTKAVHMLTMEENYVTGSGYKSVMRLYIIENKEGISASSSSIQTPQYRSSIFSDYRCRRGKYDSACFAMRDWEGATIIYMRSYNKIFKFTHKRGNNENKIILLK